MNNIKRTNTSLPTSMAEVDASSGASTTPTPRTTKSATVTKLLSRTKGATLGEISGATGWQSHSCRAFLTGLRKKGKELIKEQRADGATAYRIVATVPDVVAS